MHLLKLINQFKNNLLVNYLTSTNFYCAGIHITAKLDTILLSVKKLLYLNFKNRIVN